MAHGDYIKILSTIYTDQQELILHVETNVTLGGRLNLLMKEGKIIWWTNAIGDLRA